MTSRIRGTAATIAALFGLIAATAHAQDEAAATESAEPTDAATKPRTVEEIVVTAQKREQSLQDVPLAVTALGAEELEARGLNSLASFQQGAVPSLRLQPFAGQPTTLSVSMRGFAQTNGAQVTLDGGVPVYIDDIYFGRPQGLGIELIEPERIEVLRGPQGTLFGKNSAGGAVRFVSKKPSGVFGIRQDAEVGSFGYWRSATHIDLPEVGGVAAKLDLLLTDNDGWIDNPGAGQEDLGRVKGRSGRLSLRWQPSDALTVDYAYDTGQTDSTSAYAQVQQTNDPYQIWPVQPQRQDDLFFPLYRPFNDEELSGHLLNASWQLSDSISLRSITGYRELDSLLYNTPAAAASFPGCLFTQSCSPDTPETYLSGVTVTYDISHEQFSQEFQLVGVSDGIEWVAGLFYLNDDATQAEQSRFGTIFPGTTVNEFGIPTQLGPGIALDPPLNLTGAPPTLNAVENRSWAVFGQATWRPAFDDRLALTLGLRYGDDRKEATRNTGQIFSEPSYPGTTPDVENCPCAPVKNSESQLTPLAVVAYDWTDTVSTYLRFATGYRASGVGLNSQTFQPFDSDTVYSYEAGLKSRLFEGRVQFNAAAFHMDWKDPQLNVQTVSNSVVEFFNGPDITIRGLELDATALLFDDLTLNLSMVAYDGRRPEADNPYAAPGGDGLRLRGEIVQLPDFAGSASLRYDVAHTRYGTLRANIDASGSAGYNTVENSEPVPGYVLWNARLGLANIAFGPADGRLDLTLWGMNLLDREYRVFQFNVPGIAPGTESRLAVFGMPRTVGLSLAYRY